MSRTRSTARTARTVFAAVAGLSLALSLAACAQAPDPQETKESIADLSAEADSTELSDAEQKFSVAEHPEPIVDPLMCTPHLILTVRGTSEPAKNQLVSPVARAITQALPRDSAQTVDIAYPASGDMGASGAEGVRRLVDTLNQQAERCPLQRIVVLAYSQGAMVAGDALESPADRAVGRASGEVSDAANRQIEAVVLYADPRFRGSAPYNAGDFSPEANGLLARAEDALAPYADRLRSFCVADDFICQGGSFNETGHVQYYSNGMQADGAEFVIDILRKSGALDATPDRTRTADRDSGGGDSGGGDSGDGSPDSGGGSGTTDGTGGSAGN